MKENVDLFIYLLECPMLEYEIFYELISWSKKNITNILSYVNGNTSSIFASHDHHQNEEGCWNMTNL